MLADKLKLLSSMPNDVAKAVVAGAMIWVAVRPTASKPNDPLTVK